MNYNIVVPPQVPLLCDAPILEDPAQPGEEVLEVEGSKDEALEHRKGQVPHERISLLFLPGTFPEERGDTCKELYWVQRNYMSPSDPAFVNVHGMMATRTLIGHT